MVNKSYANMVLKYDIKVKYFIIILKNKPNELFSFKKTNFIHHIYGWFEEKR
jgi:hypothetical protein